MAKASTVTILYTESDEEWCKYVVESFSRKHIKIEVINVTALDNDDASEIKTALGGSQVVMLLASCYFLEYMEGQHSWLAPFLQKKNTSATTIVAATLGVECETLRETADKYSYDHENWAVISIDVSGSNISECVSTVLKIAGTNTGSRAGSPPSQTADDMFSASSSVEVVEMIPREVHEAGEKIVLIFSKEKDKGSVSVRTGGERLPVEVINPYCVTFQAPDIIGPKAFIQVDVNNTRLRRFKLHQRKTPEFSSVKFMCQSYGITSKDELDKLLADKFTSTMCSDSRAMMVLSDLVESTTKGRQDSQHPTVLHWAAANGLCELCSVLLTAPAAKEACDMFNSDGDDVADLAEKNGYQDLSDFINDFMETKQLTSVCDLYVQAMKASSKQAEFDHQYEYMSGNETEMKFDPPNPCRRSSSNQTFGQSPYGRSLPDNVTDYIMPDSLHAAETMRNRSQSELIEIQEEVKRGNFSITEAEMFLGSWKARYDTGCRTSFKDRQQSLQALKEQNRKAVEVFAAARNVNPKQGKQKETTYSNVSMSISDPIGIRDKPGQTRRFHLSRSGSSNFGSSPRRVSHDSGSFSDRDNRDSGVSQASTSSEEAELREVPAWSQSDKSQSKTAQPKKFSPKFSSVMQKMQPGQRLFESTVNSHPKGSDADKDEIYSEVHFF